MSFSTSVPASDTVAIERFMS
ncbi:hypothetical protein BGLA2_2370004 [Burkholderia gladioli]|nr:hypothetical protein BGLA2_2370004 [Burkholderia gladioli]